MTPTGMRTEGESRRNNPPPYSWKFDHSASVQYRGERFLPGKSTGSERRRHMDGDGHGAGIDGRSSLVVNEGGGCTFLVTVLRVEKRRLSVVGWLDEGKSRRS